MNDYKIHILNQSGFLTDYLEIIDDTVKETLVRVSKLIELPSIDVVISCDQFSVAPDRATGGYTPTANTVYVHINKESNNFTVNFQSDLISTLTHELHHSARRHLIGAAATYGTVLDAIVSEGLAEYFDYEVNGDVQPEATRVSSALQEKYRKDITSDYDKNVFENMYWIHGSKEKDIPFQFGYSYGFTLIKNYVKKHKGVSAAGLVGTSSLEFKKVNNKK